MTIRSNDWNGLTLANGRYLIAAKLGEGGMGSVYRALDRNIEADVVIKIPRQAMMEDPEFAGRFTREIRSLVKLSHPHIVKVTDVGAWEGTPFAVMQFLPGGSLEDRRPTGPDGQPLPCDPKEVPRWLVAVAEALDYVHAQGYVHRDVKPGNILFDAEGHAFLSDFGVAKVLASSADTRASQTAMTGAGMVLGTPEYMAPELIMGEPFDGRVDQYALAVTAYELLCGRRPFEEGAKTKVLVLHTTKAPPPLTEWCQVLPKRLSQAVLKGLAKDPNERYPSCAAMAAAVVAAAAGAVARDERVRLRCPACGNTGWMAAAEFAQLKESGRRLACSVCKTLLDVSDAGTERRTPEAGSGGTMRIAHPDSSGAHARPREPEPAAGGTMALSARGGSGAHAPQAAPGGTTALSAPGSQPQQTPGGVSQPAPARRASPTVIERAGPPSDEAAATAVFKALATSEPERPGSPARKATAAAGGAVAAPPKPVRTWVAVGAGTLGLLSLLTFVVWGLVPRPETKPATPAPAPRAATIVADTPRPEPVLPPPPPSPAQPPADPSATKSIELAKATGPGPRRGLRPDASKNWPPAGPSAPRGELAATDSPEGHDRTRATPPPNRLLAAATARKPQPAPGLFATIPFDPALLRKPVRAKDPLEKILTAPQSYSNQVVVPAGMYHLARSRADRPDGPRKYLVTERKIESRRAVGALGMSSSYSTDLELEPKLAEHLDGLDSTQREGKVAILTLWVTRAGACALVKVEILERTAYGVKPGYKHQPVVRYETLVVTPQGSRPVMADDAEWEQVDRMLSFANEYKKRFNAFKRELKNAELDRIGAQMNAMFQQSMQSVAKGLQEQQVRQRLLMPGR